MGKDRTWEQLQKEMEKIHKEMEELKAERLQDLEAKANEIGYTVVPVGQTARKTSKATGASPEAIAEWLRGFLGKGSKTEDEIRTAYAGAGLGKRIRLDKYLKDKVVSVKDGNYSVVK